MKNILDSSTQKEIENRIISLNENPKRLWGKMNANEMVCHCSDQIKMAVGQIPTKYVGNFFLETLAKQLILLGMPAPKGKVETVPELKQGIGGTKPTAFEDDKKTLLSLVKDFKNIVEQNPNQVHPAFGKMNTKQWARLCYIHLDHHLKQFDCWIVNKIILFFFVTLNIFTNAQSDSTISIWGQAGYGFGLSKFSDTDGSFISCLAANIKYDKNIVTLGYVYNGEFLSFENPGEYVKSFQLKYGRSFDFKMKGLIFPFPFLLLIRKDFSYSFIPRIGISYNEGIKRTILIEPQLFNDRWEFRTLNGYGIPIEVELKEDITNYIGLGTVLSANFNKISNNFGIMFNVYIGWFWWYYSLIKS